MDAQVEAQRGKLFDYDHTAYSHSSEVCAHSRLGKELAISPLYQTTGNPGLEVGFPESRP